MSPDKRAATGTRGAPAGGPHALEPRSTYATQSIQPSASQALFTLMPADLDEYERGALWKQLRHACGSLPLWTGEFGGYQLRVLTVHAT